MTLTPEPVPAWPPERLRIGECTVDVPLREVTAPGARRPRRVTPKAFGVLLALARQPGRVVSREALLDEVWPDTLPTNDVVTQAVTQLRKAFGEQRGDARYIETISKNGYRLLAPVAAEGAARATGGAGAAARGDGVDAVVAPSVPAAPPAPRPATVAPARRARRRWPVLAAVGAVAAAVLVAALAFGPWHRDAAPPPVRAALSGPGATPFRLITSAPGFEVSPSLSPDGAMVAYAASLPDRLERAILVQTTGPTAPRQLTRPEPGSSDRLPAWSPDGREIAFQRAGPGTTCQIRVLPASGGPERVVAGCDLRDMISFSWTPDGRGLLFGSMRTPDGRAGIRVLDLGSGRWRAIDYPSSSSNDVDYLPRYSPDGRWIGFVRNPQLGDVWLMPAEGGRPRPLTRQFVEVRGWDWLPDGRGVAFGRRVDSETRLYRVGLDGGPVQDLGVQGAQWPSVAIAARTIAFVNRRPKFDLFRFPLPGASADATGEHLFPSTGRDVQASIAPDAAQLVFGSDRSGAYGLWWADLRRPESLRLFDGLLPDSRRLAEWSWDSRRVLVTGTGDDGRYGLHELLPASGQVSRLPVPLQDPIQGLYLPDPSRLLVGAASDDDDGRLHLTLYDRSTAPWRALQRIDDVSLARVDPDRHRVLFTRTTGDGLWQANLDLDPASVRVVDPALPSRWRYRNWDIASDGRVFYVDQTAQCQTLLREIAAKAPAAPRCLHRDRLSATNGVSVSGRNSALYMPLATEDGTDIAFMPLPPDWGGDGK